MCPVADGSDIYLWDDAGVEPTDELLGPIAPQTANAVKGSANRIGKNAKNPGNVDLPMMQIFKAIKIGGHGSLVSRV